MGNRRGFWGLLFLSSVVDGLGALRVLGTPGDLADLLEPLGTCGDTGTTISGNDDLGFYP